MKSNRFEMTRGWVINGRIFSFFVNYIFKKKNFVIFYSSNVIPNLYEFLSSLDHKKSIFWRMFQLILFI